jgi:hypothetical protein
MKQINDHHVDKVVDCLRDVIGRYFERSGALQTSKVAREAADIIDAARYINLNPEEGHPEASDESVVRQLEHAAKVCDSSLMEVAALRLRRHLRRPCP